MRIYRMVHQDMMGFAISEQFFDSKNKAKKAFDKKNPRSFELMFEVYRRCSYEYDEWDAYVESLHIELIQVN